MDHGPDQPRNCPGSTTWKENPMTSETPSADEVFEQTVDRLKRIYHLRTAGDYTFEGVLTRFVMGLKKAEALNVNYQLEES